LTYVNNVRTYLLTKCCDGTPAIHMHSPVQTQVSLRNFLMFTTFLKAGICYVPDFVLISGQIVVQTFWKSQIELKMRLR